MGAGTDFDSGVCMMGGQGDRGHGKGEAIKRRLNGAGHCNGGQWFTLTFSAVLLGEHSDACNEQEKKNHDYHFSSWCLTEPFTENGGRGLHEKGLNMIIEVNGKGWYAVDPLDGAEAMS